MKKLFIFAQSLFIIFCIYPKKPIISIKNLTSYDRYIDYPAKKIPTKWWYN